MTTSNDGEARQVTALANLKTQQLKTRRTLTKVVGIPVAGAGLIAAAVFGLKTLENEVPHVQELTQSQVGAALDRVSLTDLSVPLTAHGSGTATQTGSLQGCVPIAGCHTIPGLSEYASAAVQADLQMVIKPGAVSIVGVRDSSNPSGWAVRVLVDPKELGTQLANEQWIGLTYDNYDDPFIQWLASLGVDTHAPGRQRTTASEAAQSFQHYCTPVIGTPSLIESAVAYAVKTRLLNDAPALATGDPQGYKMLTDMANGQIQVQFVSNSETSHGAGSAVPLSSSSVTLPNVAAPVTTPVYVPVPKIATLIPSFVIYTMAGRAEVETATTSGCKVPAGVQTQLDQITKSGNVRVIG